MSDHPYKHQADHAFWIKSMAKVRKDQVDPVVKARFKIDREQKVVTAGSCFAQHIARNLAKAGFNFHVTETAHPLANKAMAEEFGYGMFSARYGNVYTSRQLLQLLQRASGEFTPAEEFWTDRVGRFVDPFRPSIQPGGYLTLEELRHDRKQHFDAVMRAFREMDVFVFTFGLTECWSSKEDGAAYPLCPGVVAGTFDADRHEFQNLTVDQVVADFKAFADRVLTINPRVKYLLTVSPVPLMATASPEHVLVSTTYSKSVLRVAADMLEKQLASPTAYFPSYEVITGNHSRGTYYAEDLRSITEEGVNHVMRLFFSHYAQSADAPVPVAIENRKADHFEEMRHLVKVQCDEEALGAVDNVATQS